MHKFHNKWNIYALAHKIGPKLNLIPKRLNNIRKYQGKWHWDIEKKSANTLNAFEQKRNKGIRSYCFGREKKLNKKQRKVDKKTRKEKQQGRDKKNEKWNPILYFTRVVHMCMICRALSLFKMQYNECFSFDILPYKICVRM